VNRRFSNSFLGIIEEHTKENWGAPFVICFMLFLAPAAVSLSYGWSSLTNEIAFFAFYTLVTGLFLQITCFLRNARKSAEGDN
jgi:hypothetical protein